MEDQIRVADQMIKIVKGDAVRRKALQDHPVEELKKLKDEAVKKIQPAYYYDRDLYRIAVVVLGLLALTAAGGSLILVLSGKTTPEVLVALGSAAIGALAGLFAPSPINVNK